MTNQITGKIQKVYDSNGTKNDGSPWKKRTYVINGKFYSTFDTKLMGYEQGQEVTIDYDTDNSGKYNNIFSIYPAGSEGGETQNSGVPNVPLSTGNSKKKKYLVTVEEVDESSTA